MFDNESLQKLNGSIIHIMHAILYVFHLPRGPLSRVAIRVAIVNIRPVAGEANSNAVHPPCRIRIIILPIGTPFNVSYKCIFRSILVQAFASPKIALNSPAGPLIFASAPHQFLVMLDHRFLVDAIGDSDARVDGLRHIDQRQSKDGGRFVELCAAPSCGLLTFPVGLEGGGLQVKHVPKGLLLGPVPFQKGDRRRKRRGWCRGDRGRRRGGQRWQRSHRRR